MFDPVSGFALPILTSMLNNIYLRVGFCVCEIASLVTIGFGLFAQAGDQAVGPALIVAISGLVTAVGGIIIGGGVPMLKIWLDERKDARQERLKANKFHEEVQNVSIRIADLERKSQASIFGLIVEMAPVAILVVKDDGVLILVNHQAEQMFGYESGELIGRGLPILIPSRYRKEHAKAFREFFEAPSVRPMGEGRELFGLKKDGSEFPVEISLKPIESDSGIVTLAVIADISKRKQIEGV